MPTHLLRASFWSALLALCVAVPACANGPTVAAPRAFNRPARLAFVCFDVTAEDAPVPVPLSECRPTSLSLSDAGQQTFPVNRDLHALVTQITRGEVAAVDLTNRVILDSDVRVPGATFVPVGELPTDIVVPANSPACAWVASAGAQSITAIPTARFRPEHDRDLPDQISEVPLPGRPDEMMLSPDERTLWVSLPDQGAVARIAIDPVTCVAGAPDVITLTDVVPAGVVAVPGVDLRRVCIEGVTGDPMAYISDPATLVPPTFDPTGAPPPRPTSLEIDTDVDGDHTGTEAVLLIADASLPLIHRLDMATGAELTPLHVGAPIRDLALTPWVPDNEYDEPITSPLVTSRYLYAIDDRNGTILTIAYGEPTDAGFGAVLPVDGEFAARPDRMPILVGARAIDVITPGFETGVIDPRIASTDTEGPYLGLCDPLTGTERTDPNPSHGVLRGVFLSIAMNDATVRVADVYDLDAPCRGSTFNVPGPTCGAPSLLNQDNVYIRRHRPRAGVILDPLVTVFEGPTYTAASGARQNVGTDGLAAPRPSLGEVTCPEGMGPVFPDDGSAPRICTQLDVFSAPVETWSAVWQGTLRDTAGTGNLGESAGEIVLDARTDFCARGVLSTEAAIAVGGGAPESGYGGDLVAITSPISDAVLEASETCRGIADIATVGEVGDAILFPISRAYSRIPELLPPYVGRLVIDPAAFLIDVDTGLPREYTVAQALECLGNELVSFDVRSRLSFTVSGSRTGFLHRIVADGPDGLCTVDTSISPLRRGRLTIGQPFANTRIALRVTLDGVGVEAPTAGLTLAFRLGVANTNFSSAADAQLLVDLGASNNNFRLLALPSEVVWNELTQHLYVIEPERRGLVEIHTPTFGQVGGARLE